MFFLYFFCVITIAVGTVVCEQNYPITIGSGTVLDASAQIIAEAGPVVIGGGNVIAENVVIANRGPGSASLIIGDGNVFAASSRSESLKIGNGNVLSLGASVGRGVVLTNSCVISPGCSVTGSKTISPGTIVSGNQCTRRELNDKPYVREAEVKFRWAIRMD